MESSSKLAYEGRKTDTELSIFMKYMQNKIDYNFFEVAFDSVIGTTCRLLDRENKVPVSFDEAKNLLSDLRMSLMHINVCENRIMIFYKDDENLDDCRVCMDGRFHKKELM